MGEPKPFRVPLPSESTEIPAKREVAGKERGPNAFLEPIPPGTPGAPEKGHPQGWLHLSYVTGKWFDCGPVSGRYEEGVITKGENKGKATERLVGDVTEVRRQLNDAAKQLGIGVAIKYWTVLYKGGAKKGEEIPGQLMVKYLAGKRKKPPAPKGEVAK